MGLPVEVSLVSTLLVLLRIFVPFNRYKTTPSTTQPYRALISSFSLAQSRFVPMVFYAK